MVGSVANPEEHLRLLRLFNHQGLSHAEATFSPDEVGHHRARGQALANFSSKTYYLGLSGPAASRAKCHELVAMWASQLRGSR